MISESQGSFIAIAKRLENIMWQSFNISFLFLPLTNSRAILIGYSFTSLHKCSHLAQKPLHAPHKLPHQSVDDAGFGIHTGAKLFPNPPLLICSKESRSNLYSTTWPVWIYILLSQPLIIQSPLFLSLSRQSLHRALKLPPPCLVCMYYT